MKPVSTTTMGSLVLALSLFSAGCGSGTVPAPVGGTPGGNELATVRKGAANTCDFDARGAVTDKYPCTSLSVMANASMDSGLASLVLSPSEGATSASGMVQFNGAAIKEGTYELKDLKTAVFNITKKGGGRPSWLCQTGFGAATLGALKFQISSAIPLSSFGSDTNYAVHGVFEALLVAVDGQSAGNVILHGEF